MANSSRCTGPSCTVPEPRVAGTVAKPRVRADADGPSIATALGTGDPGLMSLNPDVGLVALNGSLVLGLGDRVPGTRPVV